MTAHDQLDLIRELLAFERAVAVAPFSQRVRDAYDSAWSAAFEASTQDQYDQLSNSVAAALTNMPCETCGGVGHVKDFQYHAGATGPEPIVSKCTSCCNRCHGSGLFQRDVDVYQPTFDADDNLIDEGHSKRTMIVYCWCSFGRERRDREETLTRR